MKTKLREKFGESTADIDGNEMKLREVRKKMEQKRKEESFEVSWQPTVTWQ